jgi:Rrf2 family protein
VRVTAFDEYGLRCLIQLAARHPAAPLTAPDVAQAEGLSLPYANKLLHELKRRGWIAAERGAKGGYRLAASARRASLARIIAGWDGHLFDERHCREYSGCRQRCTHAGRSCSLRAVWRVLSDHVRGVLDRTTLSDLVTHDEAGLERRLAARSLSQARAARGSVAPLPRRPARRAPGVKTDRHRLERRARERPGRLRPSPPSPGGKHDRNQ